MQNMQPAGRPHRNQGLFSDHYLNVTLPARPDWKALAGEARPVMEGIAGLLDSYTPSENEAQVEEDLVRPILRLLGHTFEVQPALATPEGTKRPDYVLYGDAGAVAANKGRTLTDELLKGSAFAVADAKYWERPLDVSLKGSKRNAFSNKNPGYQISFYIQHSGTEWGILTNGRLWRLYHRDTAHKLDRFYEVDLPSWRGRASVEDFLYFYAFFRRAAFEDGDLGVGALLGRKHGLREERRRLPEGPGLRGLEARGAGVSGPSEEWALGGAGDAARDLRQLPDPALQAPFRPVR